MASSLALPRATSSPLLAKLVGTIRVASASRSFNTNAQVADYDDGEDRRTVSRPRYSPSNLFEDAFDPFSRTRSLIRTLNLMDRFMKSPLVAAARGMGAVSRRGWDVKEEKDALFVRMDMPGLGKEDVKVSVEQNTLTIKGEGGEKWESDETGRKYTSRIDLPAKMYKFAEIKAEMKNGVLRVVVPKVKDDGRKEVLQVDID
ncbi:hypothetical protein PVL29_002051 [Vitis rotundifolia]|uniref:SHSP domain-containing protein n=1 Tax=Vitis rotundifolia TaxID=103349 RepID=A0AA39AGS4_VITRO|nr:hypothetical protein PVL29_002051 [Vitis rotundifolia]